MANGTHVKLSGSQRGRDRLAFEVGAVDPREKVTVIIGLSGPKLPGPDEFVGQRFEPEELEKKFGARREDAKKVAESLKKHGLKVEEVSLGTRTMRVSGTAEAMESAFKPEWAIYRSPDCRRSYRSRHGAIQIPKELEGIVTGVFGLDLRKMVRRRSGTGSGARSPLTPAKIEQRYNFPRGDGAGQSIAIAQFGGGILGKDVKAYFTKFRRPIPSIKPISLSADAPAYTLSGILAIRSPYQRKIELEESFEVTTDVELIGGLCPKASISVYFSTWDQAGWIHLLTSVIAARPVPVVLSISWGFPENSSPNEPYWSADALDKIDELLNQAALQGITTCVSAGDDGCRDNSWMATVDFPASSPNVLAVGGTMLDNSGDEVTWWEHPDEYYWGGGATGGGVSMYFQRPAWQNVNIASINPASIDGRVVPDVSALAGSPYYILSYLNMWWTGGLTSASAPVWAALIARINAKLPLHKRLPFLTPLLYQKLPNGVPLGQASCRDIVKGDNHCYNLQGYQAGPGFDAVTGWGVPNGQELLKYLSKIITPLPPIRRLRRPVL